MTVQDDRLKLLVDSIRRLLRRRANTHLKKIVNKTHAADLSRVFRSIPLAEQHRLLGLMESTEQKGVLLSQLEQDTYLDLVEGLSLNDLVDIFETMPTDDVADLVDRLPEERKQHQPYTRHG